MNIERTALNDSSNKNFKSYCSLLKKEFIKNKRLLLIQIPQIDLGFVDRNILKNKGYYIFPPAGLQYLYESIKHRDLQVEILDLNFESIKRLWDNNIDPETIWKEILKEKLEDFQPDMIGVSCIFDFTLNYFFEILYELKKYQKSLVIAGGGIPTFEWKRLLEKGLVHFSIEGEGENKLNYLFDYLLDTPMSTTATPGIHYKFNEEFYVTSGERDIVNFDTSAIDSYKLVPIEEYSKYGSLNPFSRTFDGVLPFATIQRSRGCRAHCTFCSVHELMGKGMRFRRRENVIAEIEYLKEHRGITHFEWLDDDLLSNIKDFELFLQEVIDRKLDITWSAYNGVIASSVKDRTLQLMNDSGCIGFKVGVETGSPEILQQVRKPSAMKHFLRLSEMIKAYPRMQVVANCIIGFPGEKFSTMLETFYFMIKLNYDWASLMTCQPIRGADAFDDYNDLFEFQITSEGSEKQNFIPTKTGNKGHVETKKNVHKNLDIFNIEKDLVPSDDQIKEIWYSCNFIANFIFNKNLQEGGHPEKFIFWIETARKSYPYNAYMLLFLSLAYVLVDDHELSLQRYNESMKQFDGDEYWQERFQAFNLNCLYEKHLTTKAEVYSALKELRNFYDERLHISQVNNYDLEANKYNNKFAIV